MDSLEYDWNQETLLGRAVEVEDETLRDGLQSPSVINPDIGVKLRLIHLMEELGIHGADIGLPGAGPKAREHVVRLAQEIRDQKMRLEPSCAARTLKVDIQPIVDVAQELGMNIEANVFLGSSPIRQYAEDWPIEKLLQHTEEAVKFATSSGISCMYVTEDTTRARPEVLRKLYTTAIENGASRICLADTVGHATPDGVRALVAFIKEEVVEPTGRAVKIDWHGHRDRGLAVENALAALAAGADRVHGCAAGIGERVGNTPMELLLVNLKRLGVFPNDLSKLREYCELAATSCGVEIPPGWPVVGRDAYRTATGTWASMMLRGRGAGREFLSDRIISAVPPSEVSHRGSALVGPWSGESNVIAWLLSHDITPRPRYVFRILQEARAAMRCLTEAELVALVKAEEVTA